MSDSLLTRLLFQIWRNIENNNYLNASRLYLISKAIYDNLNAGMSGNDDIESQSVKVMVMDGCMSVGPERIQRSK